MESAAYPLFLILPPIAAVIGLAATSPTIFEIVSSSTSVSDTLDSESLESDFLVVFLLLVPWSGPIRSRFGAAEDEVLAITLSPGFI